MLIKPAPKVHVFIIADTCFLVCICHTDWQYHLASEINKTVHFVRCVKTQLNCLSFNNTAPCCGGSLCRTLYLVNGHGDNVSNCPSRCPLKDALVLYIGLYHLQHLVTLKVIIMSLGT